MKLKESYGIACCRINTKTNEPEVLMIKKKYTYAFFDFVFTRYNKNDNNRLKKLFNQMSYSEKIDILQLDFDKLWCRIRLTIPIKSKIQSEMAEYNTYITKKKRFNWNFVDSDKGKRLKRLINGTMSIDALWEIPKGRPNTGEKPINTALREFKEETDISINKFTFLVHIKPIVTVYTSNNITYKHTYFMAVANKFNWNPTINFSSYEQMMEIECIDWVSFNEAKYLNMKHVITHVRMICLLKKIFNLFKLEKIKN